MTAPIMPAGPLRAIVEELVRGGVRDVVICPGSRSTPLALALRATPELRTWVQLDERAGAFFALGAAKASRRPVAVLATSGTAAVNFAPAVVEARYGRVPLLALTADRPPELQGVGAPQTIDQVDLYGRHAKWYAALPVPDDSAEAEAEARSVVGRAVSVATSVPAGPVHLNLPFREPLLPAGALMPEGALTPEGAGPDPAAPDPPAETAPDPADDLEPRTTPEGLARLVRAFQASARPLVVCGPLDAPGFAAAVAQFAIAAGVPLLADVLSGVRTGAHDRRVVVAHYDALLRSTAFREEHLPDLVVRFGARPTSKVLDGLLDGLGVPQLLVDQGGGFNVPGGPTVVRIEADPVRLARSAAVAVLGHSSADPGWLRAWLAADAAAAQALAAWFSGLSEPFEGEVARALGDALPDETVVIAGNSMPVRDLDAFLPASARTLRPLGNRGANGIDGLLSTAFGASAVQERPVVAVVGDLSLLHDLGALAGARRLGLTASIVLVNNDGGGIFSFLPQGSADRPELGLPAHFEELFGTPHGLDLGPVVSALGATHRLVEPGSLAPSLAAAVRCPGVDVLELRTERTRNVELHRAATQAVAQAIESQP